MKTIIKLAAACSILLIGVGCQEKNTAGGGASTFAAGDAVKQAKQDTVDSLTDELIVQMKNLGNAFDSAQDKASGEAFVKKLAVIGDEIEAISARMGKLETPSDEDIARIQEKMQNSTKQFKDQFGSFLVRFMQSDELGENVGSAMTEFQKRMDKLPDFLGPGKKKANTPAPPAPVPTPLPAEE